MSQVEIKFFARSQLEVVLVELAAQRALRLHYSSCSEHVVASYSILLHTRVPRFERKRLIRRRKKRAALTVTTLAVHAVYQFDTAFIAFHTPAIGRDNIIPTACYFSDFIIRSHKYTDICSQLAGLYRIADKHDEPNFSCILAASENGFHDCNQESRCFRMDTSHG